MKRAVAALAILLLAAGCSAPRREQVAGTPGRQTAGESQLAAVALPASARLIIRTADITLVVNNAAESLRRIVRIVESRGGYIADQRQWRQNNQVRATATLRIPAEKLFATLPDIRKEAIRVENETVSGEDVTDEFTDLNAQLTNLRATEKELRALLATVRERSQRAADILEVYEKLAEIRGNIERIQGRMQMIRQLTAMSTIRLELIPDALSQPIIEPGWRPMSIVKTAARALVAAGKGIAGVLIWALVLFVPLALAAWGIALVARSVVRRIRRKRQGAGA